MRTLFIVMLFVAFLGLAGLCAHLATMPDPFIAEAIIVGLLAVMSAVMTGVGITLKEIEDQK